MSNVSAIISKQRRDSLRKEGKCINGAHHGPPVIRPRSSVAPRCAWCAEVHRIGVTSAREQAARDPQAPQPPPRYKRRAGKVRQ